MKPNLGCAVLFAALGCAASAANADYLSAEEFLKAIQTRGPEAVVKELVEEQWREDVETLPVKANGFQTDYLFLMDRVATGQSSWLVVAGKLVPFTDAGFSSELREMLMLALIENPSNVIQLLTSQRRINNGFKVDQTCGDAMFSDEASHYDSILKALDRVKLNKENAQALKGCRAAAQKAYASAKKGE